MARKILAKNRPVHEMDKQCSYGDEWWMNHNIYINSYIFFSFSFSIAHVTCCSQIICVKKKVIRNFVVDADGHETAYRTVKVPWPVCKRKYTHTYINVQWLTDGRAPNTMEKQKIKKKLNEGEISYLNVAITNDSICPYTSAGFSGIFACVCVYFMMHYHMHMHMSQYTQCLQQHTQHSHRLLLFSFCVCVGFSHRFFVCDFFNNILLVDVVHIYQSTEQQFSVLFFSIWKSLRKVHTKCLEYSSSFYWMCLHCK